MAAGAAALILGPAITDTQLALGLDLATTTRFRRHPFPSDAATAVLAALLASSLAPCVYVDHDDVEVFVGDSPSTHPDHLAALGASANRGDLLVMVESLPVLVVRCHGWVQPSFSNTATWLSLSDVKAP